MFIPVPGKSLENLSTSKWKLTSRTQVTSVHYWYKF